MIREVLTLEQLTRMPADEAAALLLVRQDAGDDGHDDGVFDEWLFADPAHAEAWARACAAWSAFDVASSDDVQALKTVYEAEDDRPARRSWGLAIAASVAVIAATGGAMLLTRERGTGAGQPGTQVASVEPARLMLTTARGEHRSFRLADASIATLNTDTEVAVAFRPGGERRLELLRGQAFFKVAHDTSRPFVVAVDGRTVTALGTAFEVRAKAAEMRVILVEGRVEVANTGKAPVVMRAGQLLVAGPQGVVVSKADVASVDDWQRGVVTFRNTTLADAAAELNRYSPTQLTVDDPRLAAMRVSGVFKTSDARRFARTVEEIYPVRVVPAKGDALRFVAAK